MDEKSAPNPPGENPTIRPLKSDTEVLSRANLLLRAEGGLGDMLAAGALGDKTDEADDLIGQVINLATPSRGYWVKAASAWFIALTKRCRFDDRWR